MEKLTSENRIKKIEEIANNEIKKVIHLQRKIKQFLKLKNISYNNNRCSKQKQKMGQMEDNDNNLIIRYNSNLQNKLTSAKSQTFKNSSLNNHNESSHKEKFSKQSFHPKIKNKHAKSGKSSIVSEKINNSNNNENIGSEIEVAENIQQKEKEKENEKINETKEELTDNSLDIQEKKQNF